MYPLMGNNIGEQAKAKLKRKDRREVGWIDDYAQKSKERNRSPKGQLKEL